MRPDGWHLTDDVDDFLSRTGDFLRSRPALHTLPLTVTERLRADGAVAYGGEVPLLGWLEQSGEVRATFHLVMPRGLSLTPLAPGSADALAARLAGLGLSLPVVGGRDDTAAAFARAWQRYTGAAPALRDRIRLYRLGTLTPPESLPDGRSRAAGEQDREQFMGWCREFAADVGEAVSIDAASWAGTRFADKRFTFWETPDGTPVSMAGATPMVGVRSGWTRSTPPAHLRGRGYAGAVTVEVSRAALAQGATDVVLFADAANPISNGLYQRIGFHRLADFAVYDFSAAAPAVS